MTGQVIVMCNTCGRRAHAPDAFTLVAARNSARAAGWTIRVAAPRRGEVDIHDFCPDHSSPRENP